MCNRVPRLSMNKIQRRKDDDDEETTALPFFSDVC